MPTMPFGGFDPQSKHVSDDAWENLKTLTEFLEDGEPVPPDLASWLVQAIKHADENPNELLRRLGLKAGRGSPGHWTDEHAYRLGQAVCHHEDRGAKPDAAISAVLGEYEAQNEGDAPSRPMLQRWRDRYRAAHAEANRP